MPAPCKTKKFLKLENIRILKKIISKLKTCAQALDCPRLIFLHMHISDENRSKNKELISQPGNEIIFQKARILQKRRSESAQKSKNNFLSSKRAQLPRYNARRHDEK